MKKTELTIEEPMIISLRPSEKNPCISAENQRKRELKMHNEISQYLKQIGFNPLSFNHHTTASLIDKKLGKIDVVFQYYESSAYIKKNFEVYRNGKLSNIQTLRKLYPIG